MNGPEMLAPRQVAADTTLLPAYMPVPGFGVLPVNAFVIKAKQPVLVDTGLKALQKDFMGALRSVIDPADLRWIWITHADPDHLGSLAPILDAAPEARIVTTFVGMAKMGLNGLPVDRAYLVNPGQQLDVGDRQLEAIAPPTFDAPETTGFLDHKTSTLFSSDCFGALLEQPVEHASMLPAEALKAGQVGWASIDAPWLRDIDKQAFAIRLEEIRKLGAEAVLSSHLPPATSMTDTLLANLLSACDAPPFVGPDQAALMAMISAA